jgi:hypothetical protein
MLVAAQLKRGEQELKADFEQLNNVEVIKKQLINRWLLPMKIK